MTTESKKPSERVADFIVDLDSDQLTTAVGNYCADVLRRVPTGQYERTALSITQTADGKTTATMRFWAPPGVLGTVIKVKLDDAAPVGVYEGDGHPRARGYDREPEGSEEL